MIHCGIEKRKGQVLNFLNDIMATTTVGRPRDENSRAAITKAAFEMLLERGYAGLALNEVARRAGAGKTTIYRWWPNRAALAVESFFDATLEELAFPDSGSVAEDFHQQISHLAALLRSPRGAVLAALISGAQTDEELGAAIQERWFRPRQVWGVERLERAVELGETVENLSIHLALETLYSPLYARLFFGLGVHSQAQVDDHCRFVFPLIFYHLPTIFPEHTDVISPI